MQTETTAELFARINAREVAMIQSGECNWYEVTIGFRRNGEVFAHETRFVCASNASWARNAGNGAVRVERQYGRPSAFLAHVRRLAYRGNLHWETRPDEFQDAVEAAGYYRD